jgi:CMP-N-acetylneuraminic acid synthetase/quercetin dioxygenase-like cupin family protein
MKIIAMVPARLGSQRVFKKNLRLINGRPLISYSIETAVKSGVFDQVYVNSEADIFSEIARSYGANYYKRPKIFSTDSANNDQFALDFIKNTDGNILIQILPTSPLISVEEIKDFVNYMVDNDFDTLVSTTEHQIAGIYKNKPINFKILEPHISSQDMSPIGTYATVLMGWKYSNFKDNMDKLGFAYHGGKGKIGYFPIKGLSTIDIDNEEDFKLAEVAIKMHSLTEFKEPEYYNEIKNHVEIEVPEILKKDGVFKSYFDHENEPLVDIDQLLKKYGDNLSWCHRLVNTENNSATLIAQMPGEGNRLHFHPNWNEWWYILKGEWKWSIEGEKIIVKKGDFVFIEKGKRHKITAMGNEIAIRLAVSRADVEHVYPVEST